MKAFLLMIAALLPFAAQADFRPGRVRTVAAAELKILSATGVFQQVTSAKLSAQATDGVANYTSFGLTLNGGTSNFRVVGFEGGYCGHEYQTLLSDMTTGQSQLKLQVTDFSSALCERVINNLWEVTLTSVSIEDGSVSTLVLGGNPEHFAVTL